jgi:hypothetical protein
MDWPCAGYVTSVYKHIFALYSKKLRRPNKNYFQRNQQITLNTLAWR